MTLPLEPKRHYTVEEYLDFEGASPQEKFEYRDGFIVNIREASAMAGGSPEHSLITLNVGAAIRNRLRSSDCRAYSNDLRIRIPRKMLFAYPDLTVVCGNLETENHPTAGQTTLNPRVIVEVLSPSTELYDRREKFSLYREIPSLKEYVLVSQVQPLVEVYFRHDDGGWSFRPSEGLGSVAQLESIRIDLPLAEVFDGIAFPQS